MQTGIGVIRTNPSKIHPLLAIKSLQARRGVGGSNVLLPSQAQKHPRDAVHAGCLDCFSFIVGCVKEGRVAQISACTLDVLQ